MREVVAHLPSEFELDWRDITPGATDRLAYALRDETRGAA
jgi:hypothetical protein